MIHHIPFIVGFNLTLSEKHHDVPGIGRIVLLIEEEVAGAGAVEAIPNAPAILPHERLCVGEVAHTFRGNEERPAAGLDRRKCGNHRQFVSGDPGGIAA